MNAKPVKLSEHFFRGWDFMSSNISHLGADNGGSTKANREGNSKATPGATYVLAYLIPDEPFHSPRDYRKP
jgi:hypothetical protein